MKGFLFFRLFLVQALWNYRTLLGAGLLWVVFPALKEGTRGREEAWKEAVERHQGTFNAHPYLAGFAAGALARLEADRADPRLIQRMRRALPGPLGSLGDRFFWAGWLPLTLLLAGTLAMVGISPLWAAIVFLVLYNTPHLLVRWGGVVSGLSEGSQVARSLGRYDFPRWAERAGGAGVLLLGSLGGLLLMEALGPVLTTGRPGGWENILALGGMVLFGLGFRLGRAYPRALSTLVLGVLAGLFLLGILNS